VLLPALLVQTLIKADLSKVPIAGVGGALLLSACWRIMPRRSGALSETSSRRLFGIR
jgi:hypothetical protein